MEKLYAEACAAFSRRQYAKALGLFITCCRGGHMAEEITKLVLDSYNKPFEEIFRSTYEKNVEALIKYQFIKRTDFPDFSNLKRIFIPCDDSLDPGGGAFIYFLKESSEFGPAKNLAMKPIEKNSGLNKLIPLLGEIYDAGFISAMIESSSRISYLSQKHPVYLYYHDFDEFADYLQIIDFSYILNAGRAVFIFGGEELDDVMADPQIPLPGFTFSPSQADEDAVNVLFNSAIKKKTETHERNIREIADYYSNLSPGDIVKKINESTVRVGVITSRFTSAVQYYLRDCCRALDKLGIENETLIEKSDIHSLGEYSHVAFVNSFKPDIILVINHFRWEEPLLPAQIVFVSWLQDLLPHHFEKESAAKVGPLDFVLNQFSGHREFQEIGYPEKQMIFGPITVNPDIYRRYELTEKEIADYSSDICVISNSGNVEETFEKYLKNYESNQHFEILKNIFVNIYQKIYDDIYNEKADYHALDPTRNLFTCELERACLMITQENIQKIANEFRVNIICEIYKFVPVTWLHERGYKMKLWGKSWNSHPVLKKYAMGVAKNGETMSRILNATKIAVGLHGLLTLHPRLMETILSGCLYIGNHIPPEDDWTDARKYLKEGYELVLFKGRDDLYKKIDYFLKNKYERKHVVAAGQKRIKEDLTSEALMRNMLESISRTLRVL